MSGGSAAAQLVAINGRAGARLQIGGVERYAREVSARLVALRPDRYRLIAPPSSLAHRAGHVWEQTVLPVRARGAAAIYSPANLAPLGFPRNVVVIHDVAALAHPEAYTATYVRYQRAMLPAIARRARLVITVSAFSHEQITERLGVGSDRLRVIAPGVAEQFSPSADAASSMRRLGISGPYVISIGTASARKNLSALEPAARALRERGIELLLAGAGRGYMRAEAVGLRSLGYIPDGDLAGLYAGALAVVMPSLYEGFGLPCIEAMACGVPVVATAAGAIPETCGDAALLVDPTDAGALADAVVTATSDEGERRRLIDAGIVHAAQFSWESAARATDDAIAGVLG